jgi:hypothetical protein
LTKEQRSSLLCFNGNGEEKSFTTWRAYLKSKRRKLFMNAKTPKRGINLSKASAFIFAIIYEIFMNFLKTS